MKYINVIKENLSLEEAKKELLNGKFITKKDSNELLFVIKSPYVSKYPDNNELMFLILDSNDNIKRLEMDKFSGDNWMVVEPTKENLEKINKIELKEYQISVSYESWGKVPVWGINLESAVEWANEIIDELPLPYNPEYIDGSYKIDELEVQNAYYLYKDK